MIVVTGKAHFAPGALATLKNEMAAMISGSRAESGCIDYAYGIDTMDPDTLVVCEYWEDWAALEAHFAAPHMTTWREALGKAGVLSRDIKAMEVGATKQL